jgi:hypothetical protein
VPKTTKNKTAILILDGDDPGRELEFEIEFQLSLTVEERYEAMERLVETGLELIGRNGYSKTPAVVTRS